MAKPPDNQHLELLQGTGVSEANQRAKYHRLTAAGKAQLSRERDRWSQLVHVVIVSRSIAERLFPNGDAVNGKLWWTDPLFGKPQPRRIVGVVADVDDENVVRGPALTIYHPVQQMRAAGRLFVHAAGDPYALVRAVTRIVREMSADQPVERAARASRVDVLRALRSE